MTNSTSTHNVKPTSTAEFTDILHTAKYHVEALHTGDVEYSRKGFHKDATMERSLSLIYCLMVLATTPTTAIVEVDAELKTEGFRDNLILVKVDGRWQIVCKLFHMHEAKA